MLFEAFGRHRARADSLEPCDFSRLETTWCDTGSTLVMKGSPVRVRASASIYERDCGKRGEAPSSPVYGGFSSGHKQRTQSEEVAMEKDEATGRMKEATGDLTGDEDLQREGEVEQAEGKAKGAVDSAADKAKDVVDRD